VPFAIAVAILFGAYLANSAYYAANGRVNEDEGWYLYAAARVMEGELPYRDFAYFQAPLLPFVYGPVQQLWGPSIAAGRATSLALSAGTVALGARLAFVHGGGPASLFFLALMNLTPKQLEAFTTTRTEPLSALLLMLAAFLLLTRPRAPGASAVALAAAVLAMGTRLSSLGATLFVLVWVVQRHRRTPRELLIALVPGACAAIALAIAALAGSAEVTWFNLVEAQADRHNQLREAGDWSPLRHVAFWLRNVSRLHGAFGVVPLLSLVFCAVVAAVASDRSRARPGWVGAAAALAGLGTVAYLPNLLPRASYVIYFASVFPLFAVLVCWGVGIVARSEQISNPRAVRAALAALLALQLSIYAGQSDPHLSQERSDLAELREVAAYLRSVVPPGGTLATLDTYVAVESGLSVAPGWEMSLFSFFPQLSEEQARRYRVLSIEGVRSALMDGGVDAVVLSDRALGRLVERRLSGYRQREMLSEQQLKQALPMLARYRLARTFARFGQFRDPLYVLLPARR
jgi:hypothetical protein